MRRDGEVPQRQEPRPRRRRLRRAAQPGRGWKHRLGRAVSLKELVGDQGSPGIVLELEICVREGQSCSWKRLVRRLPPTEFRDREMIPSNCGAANPRAFSDNSLKSFCGTFPMQNSHWSQIEFEKHVLQKSTANIS